MHISRFNFLALATGTLTATIADAAGRKPQSLATLNDGKRLTVLERGKPVFVYNYAPVEPPAGVDAHFRRANYIHPLYSPDAAVVTEDFPQDHFHHRGVFWAWPNCTVNGRKMNVWELTGGRSVFEEWSEVRISRTAVELEELSAWRFDDDGSKAIEERVRMAVHPIAKSQRAIDFSLTFKNIAASDATLVGSEASGGTTAPGAKGYGGFSFRPDASNKPFTFTAKEGVVAEDRLSCETPWADISWGTKNKRGVAIIQHPSNPGYPHPGWMFRHYGFLGASWPHNDPCTLEPGESFTLRYRLIVHEGGAEDAEIARAAAQYARSV
jgi:hypothetical protein